VDHSRLPELRGVLREALGREMPSGTLSELNRRVNRVLGG
jgi:hypothetical protein